MQILSRFDCSNRLNLHDKLSHLKWQPQIVTNESWYFLYLVIFYGECVTLSRTQHYVFIIINYNSCPMSWFPHRMNCINHATTWTTLLLWLIIYYDRWEQLWNKWSLSPVNNMVILELSCVTYHSKYYQYLSSSNPTSNRWSLSCLQQTLLAIHNLAVFIKPYYQYMITWL